MNLGKKRILAAKALGVGKNRIIFRTDALGEIKEAITRQDIKNLHEEGIISLRPIHGRRKIEKRKRKRGAGKIKIKVSKRKQNYVRLTRKLRAYVHSLKQNGSLTRELYHELRKKIKNKHFKSKDNLKEHVRNIETNTNMKKTVINKKKKLKKSTKKGKTQ